MTAPSFSQNDIRPQALMAAKESALQEDIDFLLDRRQEFVEVSCPACLSTRSRETFEVGGFTYVECASCETLYMSPRAPEGLLHQFYEQSKNYAFWNEYIYPASEGTRRTAMFRPRAQRLGEICRDLGIEGGTILEVGAAYGTFCEEAVALGQFDEVIALEPTPDLAATCRSKNLKTIEAPIETADLAPQSVDVVVAWEVIEHLFNPGIFLQRTRDLLRPGGLIVNSCPNVKGFDSLVLGRDWAAIDHEHVNYFHPASLSLLYDRHGFDVIETLTPGRLDAELVRSVLLERESLDGVPRLLSTLLIDGWEEHGEDLQDLIAELGLSSHQWAIGRRR